MSKFKNIELKFLIIPMIIITICTSLILCFETNRQYKEVSKITNNTIANIIGKLKEKYSDIDSKEIIDIDRKSTRLNSSHS